MSDAIKLNVDDVHSAAMTIDVEDWFQVENLRHLVDRDSWESYESRVVKNTHRILELLEDNRIDATFFVLGWVATKHPALIRSIYDLGHEVAAHGYGHDLVHRMSLQEFKEDVTRCKFELEDITGVSINGYRAPSFSITNWAIDVLEELGFSYDSSAYSSLFSRRYGKLSEFESGCSIKEIRPGFTEVGISNLSLIQTSLPWGGGGYFRLIPYSIFRWGIKKILKERSIYVFYLHPWEIDPEQPRLAGLRKDYKFRHYLNLSKCELRWTKLLQDFEWMSISSMLARPN